MSRTPSDNPRIPIPRETREIALKLLTVNLRSRARGYVLVDGDRPSGRVQREPAAAQEAPETNARMERAPKALVQVAAGDALGQRA